MPALGQSSISRILPAFSLLAGETFTFPSALYAHSASSLNMVERWFAELTKKQFGAASTAARSGWKPPFRHFIDHHNANPKPFVWAKSADQILDSIARLCKQKLDSGHDNRSSKNSKILDCEAEQESFNLTVHVVQGMPYHLGQFKITGQVGETIPGLGAPAPTG